MKTLGINAVFHDPAAAVGPNAQLNAPEDVAAAVVFCPPASARPRSGPVATCCVWPAWWPALAGSCPATRGSPTDGAAELWSGRLGDPHADQTDPGLLEIRTREVVDALAALPS